MISNSEIVQTASAFEQILGLRFWKGSATDAVRRMSASGGLLVAPASPALLKLRDDADYRRAMQGADLVLADSALLVLLWRWSTGRQLIKISGVAYLRLLLDDVDSSWFWIVDSAAAKDTAMQWLKARGLSPDNSPIYVTDQRSPEDHALLMQLEEAKPQHVVIAVRGGTGEQLGLYLRDYLLYRPAIHCVGAALGFLTGAELPIPDWAERRRLGWLVRLASQPHMILPRIGIAFALATMVFRYRSEMPPLRSRWADR